MGFPQFVYRFVGRLRILAILMVALMHAARLLASRWERR